MFTICLRLAAILLASQLLGCVIGQAERIATLEDSAWIQKGQTTRQDIVTNYGEPALTLNVTLEIGVWEYAQYGSPTMGDVYTSGGLSSPFDARPRGQFPQVYRPPLDTLRPARTIQEASQPFWVLYDGQGVVKDFGSGPPPAIGDSLGSLFVTG